MSTHDGDSIFDIPAQALVAVVGNAESENTDVTQSIHSHGDVVDSALAPDTSESLSNIGAPAPGEHFEEDEDEETLVPPGPDEGKRAKTAFHIRRLLHKAFKRDEEERAEAGGASREALEIIKASKRHAWLESLVPGIEKLTVHFHAGNYVAVRDRSKPPGSVKVFESMPVYARIGMHLLFYGKEQVKLLEAGKVERLLKEQSIRQGKIYDAPSSAASIPSFIATYALDLSELLEPDPSKYTTFNEFFYRKLKQGARPIENAADPNGVCSAADCRLVVYRDVVTAQKFWVKGDEFTIASLLHGKPTDTVAPISATNGSVSYDPAHFPVDSSASLAIFRLAPADYHRFHSPVDGEVVAGPVDIDGTYYTVNPQAVNEVDFDVFTANKRSIIYIRLNTPSATSDGAGAQNNQHGKVIAFVAIGALLVGAINWSVQAGQKVKRGDELGYFAYGGSTCITVFPGGTIKFDDDLVTNSDNVLETLVKVGSSIGTLTDPTMHVAI